MAHLVTVAAQPKSVENFRGDLIRAVVKVGHGVTAMSAPATGDEVGRIRALGAEFRPYTIERTGLNPLRDLQTLFALRNAFETLNPDVVLAAYIKPVIWSGLALATLRGPRFYALIEGLGLVFQPSGVFRLGVMLIATWLYRLSLQRATTVIFLNEENRDLFISRGIVPASKCQIIPGIGVNLDYFADTPLPSGSPRFLLMARLLAAKGLREYAAAARIVRRSVPDAVFQLLGPEDSSPDAVPIAEVQAWHAEGVVQYLGEALDVRPFLGGCHVYVLPSYHEGMPRTVLEAMATGRPIITSDIPGCRETIRAGENGFLVPKGNVRALAERMCWFIENRDKWEIMGQRSRELAELDFDVRKINAQLMRIMNLAA